MDYLSDDDIRAPDEVIREQLMEDTRSDFDKQMDEAILLSIRDMAQQRAIHHEYEQQLIQQYECETNRRHAMFADCLVQLNKLAKFDKEVRDLYQIVEPIIVSYCNQRVEICELDSVTYAWIFDTLKKIRNSASIIDLLNTIILSETRTIFV